MTGTSRLMPVHPANAINVNDENTQIAIRAGLRFLLRTRSGPGEVSGGS
jgi:hypothetical protein